MTTTRPTHRHLSPPTSPNPMTENSPRERQQHQQQHQHQPEDFYLSDPQGKLKPRYFNYSYAATFAVFLFGAGVLFGSLLKSEPPHQATSRFKGLPQLQTQQQQQQHQQKLRPASSIINQNPKKSKSFTLDSSPSPPASKKGTAVATNENNNNSNGDAANTLFDFAIVGFPKTATTFLHIYFNKYVDDIFLTKREMCAFYNDTSAHDLAVRSFHPYEVCQDPKTDKNCNFAPDKTAYENMEMLYKQQIDWVGRAKISGFKCPRLLEEEWILPNAMRFMRNTRFIIQLRHPIAWMQSYYNYKAKTIYPEELLPLEKMPDVCDEENAPYLNPDHGLKRRRNVCTDRTNFHYGMSRLAKTPMTSKDELDLLGHHGMSIVPAGAKEKVFVIENTQLNEEDPVRAKQLRKDLAEFLGLEPTALPPFHSHNSDSIHQEKTSKVAYINICDDKYKDVRAKIIDNSKRASKWIREYFLKSPEVIVSSKEYVLEQLEKWEEDPCDDPEHKWQILAKDSKKKKDV